MPVHNADITAIFEEIADLLGDLPQAAQAYDVIQFLMMRWEGRPLWQAEQRTRE